MSHRIINVLSGLLLTSFSLTLFFHSSAWAEQGVIKEYYLGGKLKAEISYKDGLRHGISREYYESGLIASEHNYKEGKRHGLGRVYSEQGVLQFESLYGDGKFISIKEFDKKGRPLEGVIKEYDPYGKTTSESRYKRGRLDGINRIYYVDGMIKLESVYQDGRLISQKEYDEKGKLISNNAHQ